jgi:hypothetical protein
MFLRACGVLFLCGAFTLAGFSAASGAVIMDLVGDMDGLGGQLDAGGDDVVIVLGGFDNRSAAEAAATDGAQETDFANTTNGNSLDFLDFIHTYLLPPGAVIAASVEFGIAGLEGNDSNPATKFAAEDGLFVDGILIADAFEPLIQDRDDYDVFAVAITSAAALAAIADGSATIRIDANSNGGTVASTGTSAVFYDYSKLTVTTQDTPPGNGAIPEPHTFAVWSLLGLAVTIARCWQRRLVPGSP